MQLRHVLLCSSCTVLIAAAALLLQILHLPACRPGAAQPLPGLLLLLLGLAVRNGILDPQHGTCRRYQLSPLLQGYPLLVQLWQWAQLTYGCTKHLAGCCCATQHPARFAQRLRTHQTCI
jgi:hypothetical protein